MKLTLAFSPVACSLVPYVLLSEAGAEFDTLNIDMSRNQNHSPEYLRINPKGKVPTLIIDGYPLTENVAMQIWISRTFPQAGLLPQDPLEQAKAISVMSWCSAGLHPKLTQQARPERYCSIEGTADNVKALGSESLFEMLEIADEMLAGREWFLDQFSCADVYFYWVFRRSGFFKPGLAQFTHCAAHMQRMEKRPSVQKFLVFEAQVKAQFAQS
jgi:glutathione S-transferase